MKSTLPVRDLALLSLGFLMVGSLHAQVLVGFDTAPPSGPYGGTMSDASNGSATLGSVSSPISFGFADPGSTWTKNLSFDISTSGMAQGAILTLTEHLQWNGTGPSPFTDWHESIVSSDFTWQGGHISIGPSNGSVSNGGKDITFNFAPQAGTTGFDVQKTLIYIGEPLPPGGTKSVQIVEQPSVPEVESMIFWAALALLAWGLGRGGRWRFQVTGRAGLTS